MRETNKQFGTAGAVLVLMLFSFQAQADTQFDSVFNDSRVVFDVASAPRLGGDAGLACEMKVCLAGLAAGINPSECARPLRRYFKMKPSKRARFLRKCPTVSG